MITVADPWERGSPPSVKRSHKQECLLELCRAIFKVVDVIADAGII